MLPSITHDNVPVVFYNAVAPDLRLTWVFACSAHFMVLRGCRQVKRGSLTVSGVFICYSLNHKVFRVFTKDGRIVEFTEVIFNENLFLGLTDNPMLIFLNTGGSAVIVSYTLLSSDHSYPSSLTADFPPAEVVPSDSPEMMYSISILESMVLSSSELVVLKKRMLLFDNFTNVVSLAPITRNNFLVL